MASEETSTGANIVNVTEYGIRITIDGAAQATKAQNDLAASGDKVAASTKKMYSEFETTEQALARQTAAAERYRASVERATVGAESWRGSTAGLRAAQNQWVSELPKATGNVNDLAAAERAETEAKVAAMSATQANTAATVESAG